MWWIRFKSSKEVLVINKRVGMPSVLGEYILGYKDRSHAIRSLRASGIMATRGLLFKDLELFNGKYTMDDVVTYAVQEGYALRHRREGWYWNHPGSGRVWYANPGRIESVWRENERDEAYRQARKVLVGPAKAGLELVCGDADGSVEIRPNWFV